MLLTAPEIYNLQNGSAEIRSMLCSRHHPNTSDYETTPGKGNTFSRSLVAIAHAIAQGVCLPYNIQFYNKYCISIKSQYITASLN